MKKLTCLLCLPTLILLLSSCKEKTNDPIIFHGKLENPKGPLTIHSPFSSEKSKRKSYKIELSEDGSFQDTLLLGEGVHTIFDGKQVVPFYFGPSGEYYLAYDLQNFSNGQAHVSGSHLRINQYLVEKEQQRNIFNPYGDGLEQEAFRDFLGGIKKRDLERLEKADLPQDLYEQEKKNIQYAYLRWLFFYMVVNDNERPSPAIRSELDIDYEDEALYKTVGDYHALVFEYFSVKRRKIGENKKALDPSYSLVQNELRELDALVSNEYIKNNLIQQIVIFDMKRVPNLDAYFEDFQTLYTGKDSSFTQKIELLYKGISQLKKGTPSPKFQNYVNYAGGKSGLDDFLGSYVYIDLWATWCMPCYTEFPLLQDLVEEYEGKNLKIISIAWKDNKEDWRKRVQEKAKGGTHLWAPEPKDEFFEGYGVTSIPRFILLDPEGRIVDHNAPRPSESQKLKRVLESLEL